MRGDQARPYDLVVYGATSFVGRLVVEYLDGRLAGSGLRWAVGGRNVTALTDLAEGLHGDVDVVVADAHDREAVDSLVRSTQVVLSTVGPYALHGSLLVGLCASSGTDYCDLTGEPQWMQRMIDAHHDAAVASGARLVHACGFDSIPSDLGVCFTQAEARERLGEPCSQISMRVRQLRGGVSGGTIASLLNLVEEASHHPAARRLLANPYALAPEGMREGVRQHNVLSPIHDEASGQWIAPFVMAAVNVRVVHRSHALLGRPWGEDFLYDEAVLAGRGPGGLARATALSAGLLGAGAAAGVGPLRRLLADRVLPQPGDGPDREARESGSFVLDFHGSTRSRHSITTSVSADRDPGYGATARMVAEAALALHDSDPANLPGGFWTPATAFGADLIPALEQHAGLAFAVLDHR